MQTIHELINISIIIITSNTVFLLAFSVSWTERCKCFLF